MDGFRSVTAHPRLLPESPYNKHSSTEHTTPMNLTQDQYDQISTKFAALSNDQLRQFIENYAEKMVDDMDTKCLMQFVYDTIVENLSIQSPDDILEQISCCYDDETIEELLESVTP